LRTVESTIAPSLTPNLTFGVLPASPVRRSLAARRSSPLVMLYRSNTDRVFVAAEFHGHGLRDAVTETSHCAA
jgi:hypothetical protein